VLSCVKDGKWQDAEEFLGLYLDALDEELVELHANISIHKPASAPSVEGLEEEARSVEGQTEVGKRDCVLFNMRDVADVCTDTNRQVQSSHPSRAYSVEGLVRPYARQASPTPSLSKPGDRSNSNSRSVFPPFSSLPS
jgi:hypothetical protein